MEVVIDANILFAALIRDSHTRHLIRDNNLQLYSPDYLLREIEKYMKVITAKSEMSEEKVKEFLELFITQTGIKIISSEVFDHHIDHSLEISPDPKDAPYLALCLHRKCPLWSNDKQLKKQEFVQVFNTEELTAQLEA